MRRMVTLIGVLSLLWTATVNSTEPTLTLTMRLAEAEWQVVRQEILPPFETACRCRVQAGRMQIDVFAQDNMRLQELVDAKLDTPTDTSRDADGRGDLSVPAAG